MNPSSIDGLRHRSDLPLGETIAGSTSKVQSVEMTFDLANAFVVGQQFKNEENDPCFVFDKLNAVRCLTIAVDSRELHKPRASVRAKTLPCLLVDRGFLQTGLNVADKVSKFHKAIFTARFTKYESMVTL